MRRRVLAQLAVLGLALALILFAPNAATFHAPRGTVTTPPAHLPGAHPHPRFRLAGCRSHGELAYRHGPRRREVAIGFDDGPSAETSAFVSMLEREGARATFFVIGSELSLGDVSLLARELRDGDVIGDHTFTHPDLVRSGGAASQLERTLAAVRALSGYVPCVFRPPYGAYDEAVVRTASSLGLATVLWNVDPSDWARPGASAIVARVLAQVQPGSIIVSHDGGGNRAQTLAAYPAIIHSLRARGYRIVTIPELLGFRPVYVPCVLLCDRRGVTRRELARGALIEPARSEPVAPALFAQALAARRPGASLLEAGLAPAGLDLGQAGAHAVAEARGALLQE
jgi:peptidoglycan/xylan/chitin deacetylase (PgdA/CDA1 family)